MPDSRRLDAATIGPVIPPGFAIRANRGLGFPQSYGPWGHLGASLASRYGFSAPGTGGPDESSGRLRR